MKNVLGISAETFVQISKDFSTHILRLQHPPKFSSEFLKKLGFGRLDALRKTPLRISPKMSYMQQASPALRKKY